MGGFKNLLMQGDFDCCNLDELVVHGYASGGTCMEKDGTYVTENLP
jgi:hypothetical protein